MRTKKEKKAVVGTCKESACNSSIERENSSENTKGVAEKQNLFKNLYNRVDMTFSLRFLFIGCFNSENI